MKLPALTWQATPPPRTFEVTLIHGSTRTVRKIIAHAAMQATSAAINMLPDVPGQFAIICKPATLKAKEI